METNMITDSELQVAAYERQVTIFWSEHGGWKFGHPAKDDTPGPGYSNSAMAGLLGIGPTDTLVKIRPTFDYWQLWVADTPIGAPYFEYSRALRLARLVRGEDLAG